MLALPLLILSRFVKQKTNVIGKSMKNTNWKTLVGIVGTLVAAETVNAEFVSADGASRRATLDFETGFVDKQAIGTTVVEGVGVSVGTLSPGGVAYISEVGGDVTGFAPNDDAASERMGRFFVSDEPDRLTDRFDYVVSFSEAVSDVALDAYDFRADGGGRAGDTVTLNAYDAMNQLVGSDTYTIVGNEPDGNAITFGVNVAGIRRVELVHSGSDVGTGIDNISFDVGVAAAPEPAEWAMIGMGVLVLGVAYRRRQASQEVCMG